MLFVFILVDIPSYRKQNVFLCYSSYFRRISGFFLSSSIIILARCLKKKYITKRMLLVLYNKNGPPCSFVCKSKNDAPLLEVALCQDVLMGMIVYVFSLCCYNFLLENEVALHLNLLH